MAAGWQAWQAHPAPAAGSFFAGWTGGGCAGTGTSVITLTADTTVTAVYTLTTTSITFSDDRMTVRLVE